jgi:hypothetical protein
MSAELMSIPAGESRWIGDVRNRKRRSANPTAEVEDFEAGGEIHAFEGFGPEALDVGLVVKELEEIKEVSG